MKFTIARNNLLKSLQMVVGVVEKRQTLPILSNVLIETNGDNISFLTSDSEIQIQCETQALSVEQQGSSTIPARKLFDITRSLPEEGIIEIDQEEGNASVKCDKSMFSLASISTKDFPFVDITSDHIVNNIQIPQSVLKQLIEKTAFAMAAQDVRFYLNGTLFELSKNQLRLVTTDGHRLAIATSNNTEINFDSDDINSNIIPRKGVLELHKLLDSEEQMLNMIFTDNMFSIKTDTFKFISKQIDGEFPDYNKVIPEKQDIDRTFSANRDDLKKSFLRASILSNEKYRGVKFKLNNDLLTITASNPHQEQAEEQLSVEYKNQEISDLGYNVSYLLDVVNVLHNDSVNFIIANANNSALIEDRIDDSISIQYIVMPMRL